PVEAISERESLPALVLQGSGVALPLTLQLADAAGLIPAGVTGEPAPVPVGVVGGKRQAPGLRRWVRRRAAQWLDVELPAAPAFLEFLQITLGDKRFDQIQVVDESGTPSAPRQGRIVRIPLEAIPEGQAREVSISYRIPLSNGNWLWD